MATKQDRPTKVTALRRQAEEQLCVTNRDVAALPVKDVQRLVHELQVHQVELEMQNEALRQTEAELTAARDRYVSLYDGAPTGYLTVNPKGMILEANLPACRLLGINRKDLIGKPLLRSVAAKDQAAWLRHLRELFSTGSRQVCEVELSHKGRDPVCVQFESVAVQMEDGPTLMRTTLLDITERTRAAAVFQAWQQGLQRQRNLEERGRLGHDLHDGVLQSLFAVGLGLEASKLFLLKAPDKTEALLTKSIGELNSVMQAVRTFIEELETGNVPGDVPPLDLAGSLRAMADTLAEFHSREVRLSVDEAVAKELSPVQRLEILRLAKEALSNSFRHARATNVQVSLLQKQGLACFAVRDNGVGFDRKAVSGKGHGLASMAARAGSIGGTLSVISKPEQGTCVLLNLSMQNGKNESPGKGDCLLQTHEKQAGGSRTNAAGNLPMAFNQGSLRTCPFCAHATCALGDAPVRHS